MLGFPSPLLADSTSGYKKQDSCLIEDEAMGDYKYILAKKENSNSKKWGTYYCDIYIDSTCWTMSWGSWKSKGASYDYAHSQYEYGCQGNRDIPS